MTSKSTKSLPRVECPEPVEGLSWVYMLQMSNGTFYIGQTNSIAFRLKRHSDGSGARQTQQLKNFNLVYYEDPMAPETAIQRERQLKKWSRDKKLALIQSDFERLKVLSKSRD